MEECMGCHRGCAGRRDVWAVLGLSVVHGMLQELCLVEGCVGCLVVRGMRWGSLLWEGVCGVLWVVLGALGLCCVQGCGVQHCGDLCCPEVCGSAFGSAVEEDRVGWTKEVVMRFRSQ